MQIKTILNRVQKFKSFVYGAVRWVEDGAAPALEVECKPPAHPRRLTYPHSVRFLIPFQRQQLINAAVGPGGELVQGVLDA